MSSADESTPTIKSALRVMLLVELLTQHPDGMTFPEIRTALELPKSSLHGLLKVMSGRGHLIFDPGSKNYRLGVRYWAAGQAYRAGADLATISLPYLEAARDTLDETVQLSVLDGLENVYIAKVDSDQVLQLVSRVGSRLPAHATGLGKVLLAHLDPEELDRRLDGAELKRFTPTTVADADGLRQVLHQVRASGYATDDGEYTRGVFCVAVPVRGRDGEVVAAMSCSVPSIRVDEGTQERMIDTLREQSRSLSAVLGHRDNQEESTP